MAESKVDALSTHPKFTSWADATVGPMTTFHAKNAGHGPEYVPSAYVFAIEKGSEDVGYVTAAARSNWAPILEYSAATPPGRLVEDARSLARERGVEGTGRLLYHGGVQYGLELQDGRALNLRNGRPSAVGVGIDPSGMSFDPAIVDRQRAALEGTGGTVSTSGVTTLQTFDSLWDVPAWTEHDDGNASSTSYGSGADSWDDWDGCTPIAASMIVAYHEGYTESDTWIREYYIDRLHDDMNTNDAGDTWPTDIDNGFDNFSEGSYSYNGTNIYVWTHPDFTKSEISTHNRPFLLNMTSGGTANDRTQAYGDHTTTVVGYASNGDELELHDTWDDTYHYLTWGSWTACSYTKVTKS